MSINPTRAAQEQALIAQTRPFATEHQATSWLHVLSTLGILAAGFAVAGAAPWWPVRLAGSLFTAGMLIRTFILFHDHMHGSLLRGSKPGKALFSVLGVLMLTPPRVWAATHNHHHANTGRLSARPEGTFTLWTVQQWRAASLKARVAYVLERHPVTMAMGLLTVFVFGLCLIPFVRDPRKNLSAGLAALVHVALTVGVIALFGVQTYLFAMLVPMVLAYAFGSYLFFVQHNFEEALVREESDWSHAAGAVEASSYLSLGPVGHWFSGNIGYHHVHHLNPRIPFYRLPEAMEAIPALQDARVARLTPREVWKSLTRLDLWDHQAGRFVSFREARPTA